MTIEDRESLIFKIVKQATPDCFNDYKVQVVYQHTDDVENPGCEYEYHKASILFNEGYSYSRYFRFKQARYLEIEDMHHWGKWSHLSPSSKVQIKHLREQIVNALVNSASYAQQTGEEATRLAQQIIDLEGRLSKYETL